MLFPIGLVIVLGCVAGGYAMHHGNFAVLWQPNEVVIIMGAAFGAFLISNPTHVIKGVGVALKNLFRSAPFHKADYIDLLTFMYNIFKIMKTKGMLEVEPAIENPEESELFTNYPKFAGNHHGVEFFCDYIRIMTMGMDNHHQMDDLMEAEIEMHHHELATSSGAMAAVGDGMPALGIVAAVLGVIQTMGSISEPPEILGGLIGAALVGTFLGILVAYGVVSPMASSMTKFGEAETEYYRVIKAGIIAHMQGNAPAITVEFARKVVPGHDRPSFVELDGIINGTPDG